METARVAIAIDRVCPLFGVVLSLMKIFNGKIKKLVAPEGSAVLTTLFILFGVLAASMIGIEVMLSGFSAYFNQGASSIAYYAAESGVERALMLYKKDSNFFHNSVHNCQNDYYLSFNGSNYTSFDIDVNNAVCTSVANLATYTFTANRGVDYRSSNLPKYLVRVTFGEYQGADNAPTWNGTGRVVKLNSLGEYLNTAREIEVVFCVPDCALASPGDPDSCGGLCY